MDGLKLYCLQQALEFLHREGRAPEEAQTVVEYANVFHSYVQSDKPDAQVVVFKPKGVN